MGREKLLRKLKLWMVLHGMEKMNDFERTNCIGVGCKYADAGNGACGSLEKRRRLNDITLFHHNDNSEFPICVTWLEE